MIALYPETCVYVLHVVGTHNYKIGMTRDPKKRIGDWRNTIPFVKLTVVAVYYTAAARTLESDLHAHFRDHRVGRSEWFKLYEDGAGFFQKSEEEILEFFGIDEISNDHSEPVDGPYSNTSGLPEPEKINHEDEEFEQMEPLKLVPEEPQRLRRIEKGETIDPEKIVSLEEEFYFGIVPEVRDFYEELGTWQAVADHYGVPKEIVWAIGAHEDDPISFLNDIRSKLGLSTLGATGVPTYIPMPPHLK